MVALKPAKSGDRPGCVNGVEFETRKNFFTSGITWNYLVVTEWSLKLERIFLHLEKYLVVTEWRVKEGIFHLE
jgi:hypothetical protein